MRSVDLIFDAVAALAALLPDLAGHIAFVAAQPAVVSAAVQAFAHAKFSNTSPTAPALRCDGYPAGGDPST